MRMVLMGLTVARQVGRQMWVNFKIFKILYRFKTVYILPRLVSVQCYYSVKSTLWLVFLK